ncbi:MAG: hypothetical protein QOG03_796 [Actinomycetota bacterium]|jgi:hypothetical protein|nr:hypothetical protein [Actinomycetota bacterium]
MRWGSKRRVAALGGLLLVAALPLSGPAVSSTNGLAPPSPNFAIGNPQETTAGAAGCAASNGVSEPIVKVAADDSLVLASENGLGTGTEVWHQANALGGTGASACDLTYAGQPNTLVPAVGKIGLSGGDVDLAIAPVALASGGYRMYMVSTGGGNLALSHSEDNGASWITAYKVPAVDIADRPFITSWGQSTAVAVVHGDLQESVLRTDDGGVTWNAVAPSPGEGEYGFIAADTHSTDGIVGGPNGEPGFYLYQPSEAGVAVSNDGGFSWELRNIGCGFLAGNQFPTVSVAPDGSAWVAWSDSTDIHVAVSRLHGRKWTCNTTRIAAGVDKAVMPAMVATSNGVDLAYYGAAAGTQFWNLFFVQSPANDVTKWTAPEAIIGVHTGEPCQDGIACTGGRQLYDDFGIDVDSQGWAHITFSHDGPPSATSGEASSGTGYAVQTGGHAVGGHG